nr:hypothetical protein [Paraburkholderia tropica]
MSFQIDIEDEQALRAVFKRLKKTCANRLMDGMCQIGKAVVAACKIHHEAVRKTHAVSFRRHVRPALKVSEGDAWHFR